MNRDVMEAHLVVLGWWPVRFKPHRHYRGWVYGVRSARQYCGEIYRTMTVDYVAADVEVQDIEWWVITDGVLRAIVQTVDAAGFGGWDGE